MDFPAIESACGHRSGHVQAWALSILLYSSVGADPLMIFASLCVMVRNFTKDTRLLGETLDTIIYISALISCNRSKGENEEQEHHVSSFLQRNYLILTGQ